MGKSRDNAAKHLTAPKGFSAAGVASGIKRSGREDLAIIAAERDVPAAVVLTRNQVVGAPIIRTRNILPKGFGKLRAVVVNSGNSNVCTGKRGLRDAESMASLAARELDADPDRVLVASTGIIGHRLPMDRIRDGIPRAAASLGVDNDAAALRAMMTTDLAEKSAVATLRLAGRTVTLGGAVKGSGMIAPSMATMIAVVTTDAPVSPAALHKALTAAAAGTFNAVTVDSDTSTSDTAVLLASGAAGGKRITTRSDDYADFAAALEDLCRELARKLAADGEGATKVIDVHVTGARSDAEAETAAKSVANSPLFKCAMHGCDPNWGRIAMALGKSSATVDQDRLNIRIGGKLIFSRGAGRAFDAAALANYLDRAEVEVSCDLGLGAGSFTAITCDLSREYVAINADYHT